jgi:hypothetical protein
MAEQFPKGRTAFMVIHGIGEQMPFETLDSFSRGVVGELKSRKTEFSIEHRLVERKQSSGGWTESFVRLKAAGAEDLIDIHECYWAYLTEEKASLGDIWNWLALTALGTLRFYQENEALHGKYEERRQRRKSWSLFKFPIYKLVFLAIALYPLIWLATRLLPRFLRTLLGRVVKPAATWIIVGYVGDVAIYTTTDEKSKFSAIRNQILAVSQSLLLDLLADKGYDRVILAGHSLGSVIAYDTLNRINLQANVDADTAALLPRLKGLVTFGSPLDKIAFFFRQHTKPAEAVRRKILAALHSFRAKDLDPPEPAYAMTTQVTAKFDPKLPWLNFFDEVDPVSGHLDFYENVDNRKLSLGAPWGVAHVAYWANQEFYEEIFASLLDAVPG